MTPRELRTPQAVLRPFVEAAQDEAIVRVIAAVPGEAAEPRTEAQQFVHAALTRQRSVQAFAAHGYGLWLVLRADGEEAMGWCGLKAGPDPALPELMYGLMPPARGKGLATEAVCAVLAHAMALPGVTEVWGAARPTNPASARVMERAGLVFAGRSLLDGAEYDVYRTAPALASA